MLRVAYCVLRATGFELRVFQSTDEADGTDGVGSFGFIGFIGLIG